jgi:hypothetical protein
MLRRWWELVDRDRWISVDYSRQSQIILDSGRYVTLGLYITLSGATLPLFSFSLALDPRL